MKGERFQRRDARLSLSLLYGPFTFPSLPLFHFLIYIIETYISLPYFSCLYHRGYIISPVSPHSEEFDICTCENILYLEGGISMEAGSGGWTIFSSSSPDARVF